MLLEAVIQLAESPLTQIAEKLRSAVSPYLGCSALVVFTEECTGRPQKKCGAEEIISRVTIEELDRVRTSLSDLSPRWGRQLIGGQMREALVLKSSTNALLVLTDPVQVLSRSEATDLAVVVRLWHLAAVRIREKVAEAPPSYLRESRAASAERARITAELTDQHSTTLETLLAVLRSPAQDDATARRTVTDLAATALVFLRTQNDRTAALLEEAVVTAFQRLLEDLKPLVRFRGIDMQFVEPPINGRALPGEVAHAARAIVRGLVLAMVEQKEVHRIRTQWDCDGTNLLINMRDDGKGELSLNADSLKRLEQRVEALHGRISVEVIAGWGADVSVVLPLDPPQSTSTEGAMWNLGPREEEVLRLLVAGLRNRAIAGELQVSENTIKFHMRNLFRKLGVSSRAEAISLAVRMGFPLTTPTPQH
ncbi:helix-turn-helix transcriptional regulator [Kocuria sp. CNJ-770]|nr:helix-turn-helix transcriptional regulator [Kocuria sp. CNJ-770]